MKDFHNTLTSQDRTGQDRTGQDRTGQDRTGSDLGIPILQKLYDFYLLLYQYIKLFPKKDKYNLGGRLDTTTLTIFECLFSASQARGIVKLDYLQKASAKLDILKIQIRLAKDVQAIDVKKYFELQEILQEIGKMLGGSLRATKQNT